MSLRIPRIIHQVWEGKEEPLPEFCKLLGKSWQKKHPDWKYVFWDAKKIDDFLKKHFSYFIEVYNDFPYNIQRWDAIRYLILYQYGGLYVDFDFECLENLEPLLENKECCFGYEPDGHKYLPPKYDKIVGNAIMATVPRHPFYKLIIDKMYKAHPHSNIKEKLYRNKIFMVLFTTGPGLVTEVYDGHQNKEEITIFDSKYLYPLTNTEVKILVLDKENPELLDEKLRDAYAVHYLFSLWIPQVNE